MLFSMGSKVVVVCALAGASNLRLPEYRLGNVPSEDSRVSPWLRGSVYIADVDGDGLADLINVGSNFRNGEIDIALGHGDGSFSPPITAVNNIIGSPGGLVVRNFGLDWRHDLAVAADQGLGTGDEATHVLLNQNGQTNCAPPPSSVLAVHICSPSTNAGVHGTFAVSAGEILPRE